MQAGNVNYVTAADLPETIPVFPLTAALLLPGGRMPLNIFEPRYLEMIDVSLSTDRLIGMVQPSLDGTRRPDGEPDLCEVGCIGRVTSFAETGDGRCLVTLQGVCRFRIIEEVASDLAFRRCRIGVFAGDLHAEDGMREVDRDALLKVFKAYLDANSLEADWNSVSRADNATLVNALSMMSPYGAVEKQALLEAADLRTRAEILVAITEMALARGNEDFGASIQ